MNHSTPGQGEEDRAWLPNREQERTQQRAREDADARESLIQVRTEARQGDE